MMSNGMYLAIGILILIMVLVVIGRKSVHHEIFVDAAPSQVWSVLIQTDDYPAWNPVMKMLEGEIKEGQKVKYRFTQNDESTSEIGAKVKEVVVEKLLNQNGGIPLILTFDHKYILEENDDKTELIIHEDYRGLGVNFWNPASVKEAYIRLGQAIKERAEGLDEKE